MPTMKDDLAIFSDSIKDTEKLLRKLENAGKVVLLQCNAYKTKYMSYNQGDGFISALSGRLLKAVERFV